MIKVKEMIEEFKIKGMICNRCLKVLRSELTSLGANVLDIKLGKISIKYNPKNVSKLTIEKIIIENEFEIIKDKETILAEEIRQWILKYVWNSDLNNNLSEYLNNKLNYNYEQLSKLFSKKFGKTIERYCVLLKIERTKELIEHDDLSFGEIAYTMGYQNLSALSRQFKRETGMTMNEYKNQGVFNRIPIDKL